MRPRDAKDVEGAVQWALAHRKSLEIVGHGTKRSLGRPAQVDATLDLAGLAGVTLYEPEELVLSAGAGTPLSEIEARWRPICPARAASRRERRATIFSGWRRCRDAARSSRPAGAW